MTGTLYVCATPIGNLEDITLRVLRVLKEVDLIVAEDTRHSGILLNHFEIHTPVTSYHEHNKYEKAEVLLDMLRKGKNIALITDAGTPAISDPGEVLVARCRDCGIAVSSLPGACACITALTMSGLPTRRFAFEAFLPADRKERRLVLEELKEETRTMVIYEAPHHLKKTLAELLETLGDRRVTVCRELTKMHEEGLRETLREACAAYETEEPRGEYVLVIEGKSREEIAANAAENYASLSLTEHMQKYLAQGMDRKDAMRCVAKDRGCSRREVYEGLLRE